MTLTRQRQEQGRSGEGDVDRARQPRCQARRQSSEGGSLAAPAGWWLVVLCVGSRTLTTNSLSDPTRFARDTVRIVSLRKTSGKSTKSVRGRYRARNVISPRNRSARGGGHRGCGSSGAVTIVVSPAPVSCACSRASAVAPPHYRRLRRSTATITITSAGMSPLDVTIAVGDRVAFSQQRQPAA